MKSLLVCEGSGIEPRKLLSVCETWLIVENNTITKENRARLDWNGVNALAHQHKLVRQSFTG